MRGAGGGGGRRECQKPLIDVDGQSQRGQRHRRGTEEQMQDQGRGGPRGSVMRGLNFLGGMGTFIQLLSHRQGKGEKCSESQSSRNNLMVW